MLSQLNKILVPFSKCFSRKKTFFYFVLVIVSFMLLTDDSGITSFVRILFLDPKTYDGLLHFFNSEAYNLSKITEKWVQAILTSPQATLFNGRNVLIGDHTKVSKEGRRMPGMKSHHQESENFGKPSTIFGFQFGMVGVLVGKLKQLNFPTSQFDFSIIWTDSLNCQSNFQI